MYVTHFPSVQNIDLHNYCVCHIISVTLTMMSVIDIAHLRAIHSRTRSFTVFIKLRFSEKATQFEKEIEFMSSILFFLLSLFLQLTYAIKIGSTITYKSVVKGALTRKSALKLL